MLRTRSSCALSVLQMLTQAFHTAHELFSLSSFNTGVKYQPTLFLWLVICSTVLSNLRVLYSLKQCRNTGVKEKGSFTVSA